MKKLLKIISVTIILLSKTKYAAAVSTVHLTVTNFSRSRNEPFSLTAFIATIIFMVSLYCLFYFWAKFKLKALEKEKQEEERKRRAKYAAARKMKREAEKAKKAQEKLEDKKSTSKKIKKDKKDP
ncbi:MULTISPECIES: hypothetical protein [unclassified Gilliamella]|uniref:hypothetical protein n=1 Tax=unclassified Gilliamella TaxID=2685620 RepID=UPI0013209E04|nr:MULTISPECIES: hypothetical protein [unclassified Gilliamella]MWN30886.1 hypothetical protein [Gilliamella sp. Pra-s60]MWP28549.1 hypothetical protein [Gilliamella sp. Pra-s54]